MTLDTALYELGLPYHAFELSFLKNSLYIRKRLDPIGLPKVGRPRFSRLRAAADPQMYPCVFSHATLICLKPFLLPDPEIQRDETLNQHTQFPTINFNKPPYLNDIK
ncbi:hypothetical protein NB640_12600 [Oxalobacter vibrioformis]|uniref:Uncharacterized protein n=1 Tax=Oxalobacter vibrioformis TaxID=933080 RepID=A0A9E9P4F4_9BURK|nr:hypothetical protein [Oxalobacter vibrioformis]WAW10036.1 hypothetical protein NB640_12600 [Oxalobacter vibrioformis]